MGGNEAKRIVSDPAILGGEPVIKGTRIAVYLILDLLSEGHSFDDILTLYPHLTLEDIKACIQYAARDFFVWPYYPSPMFRCRVAKKSKPKGVVRAAAGILKDRPELVEEMLRIREEEDDRPGTTL